MKQYLNWKTYLIVLALIIVSASLFFTSQLARKLAEEEKKKIEQVVLGIKTLSSAQSSQELTFVQTFISENTTIPMIIADEQDVIIDFRNIKIPQGRDTTAYINTQKNEFKARNKPIEADFGAGSNFVYYGESNLLSQLRLYPYVQMMIIILFLAIVLVTISTAHRSIQNQVWVGLSKETAHQLGTPLSAIEGWLELLAEDKNNVYATTEMRKDMDRLKLVADRFGKIGSIPTLKEEDIVMRLRNMVDYMQKRSPNKVNISLQTNVEYIPIEINASLFDWVIENLLRNALDALEGVGSITINVKNENSEVIIDVTDTGKGIPKHIVSKVFNPGFTTKKRGWGLGLSLAKRIINAYHHGSIFVKNSEPGAGTTFRIILRR